MAQQETWTNAPLFFEKAYLHTDRDVYLPGDDIWFKAYLLNAQTNRPIDYSHNLYAEIISPGPKVICRSMLRMDKGYGKGDFRLNDTIAPGIYRIRAYTNWMRNFGDNFIFEKNIRILPVPVQPAATAGPAVKEPVAAAPPKTAATVSLPMAAASPAMQFFPEGGSLVSGVPSLVAVKTEDIYGYGIPATGEVIAPDGETVAKFSCDSLGMGAFTLWPHAGQYQAKAFIKGKEYIFKLPLAAASGFNMSVRNAGPYLNVTVNCNEAALAKARGQMIALVARHTGKTCFIDSARLTEKGTLFRIPAESLPGGIACITILGNYGPPLCERLVYIERPSAVPLVMATDKAVYQPKERTTVTIKLGQNQKANFSLAAVDAGVVPVQEESIVTYLNLRSEIKGRIEHADRYFDTTNVNRLKQLDLLLLTQGWRGFVWKKIADTALKIAYHVEEGIDITGKVRKVGSTAPMPNINISMYAPKATGQKLFSALTDSAGNFSINRAVFYGYQYLNFTSRSSEGIKKNGTSKGFSGGWVQVDSLVRDTLVIAAAFPVPDTVPTPVQAMIDKEIFRQKFSFTGVNKLKDVAVRAGSRLVTRLPVEVHAITVAEQKEYRNLGQYLMYMIEGAEPYTAGCSSCTGVSIPTTAIHQVGFPPKPVSIRGVYADRSKIDYCTVCQGDYLDQPMSNVLKVTINRSLDVSGKNISVNVVLRPGVLETKNYFDNTVADMTGYYRSRVFYAPKSTPDDISDQRRNSIHWEPDIATDAKGEAVVSFYNKSQQGRVRLVLQGITDQGLPLALSSVYEVK